MDTANSLHASVYYGEELKGMVLIWKCKDDKNFVVNQSVSGRWSFLITSSYLIRKSSIVEMTGYGNAFISEQIKDQWPRQIDTSPDRIDQAATTSRAEVDVKNCWKEDGSMLSMSKHDRTIVSLSRTSVLPREIAVLNLGKSLLIHTRFRLCWFSQAKSNIFLFQTMWMNCEMIYYHQPSIDWLLYTFSHITSTSSKQPVCLRNNDCSNTISYYADVIIGESIILEFSEWLGN